MSAKNIEDLYRLSPMQQGMLFHSLYAPESGVYVEQVSAELQGDLNIPAFEQAWQQVLDRHPILRSAFVWENVEKPLQVVGRQVHLPLMVHDWQKLTVADQQAKLEALRQAERMQGFELSKAPLMRLILIQQAAQQYHFLWSHHHLLLDGWSTSLVLQEVFVVYEATCQGQTLRLPKPRPYRDYIGWLQQQSLPEAETFWRQTLKGFTAPTPFGVDVDHSTSAIQVGEYHTSLASETTTALQSLARQHQLTLNTLVQGAWALLLSRYSGESDVVFGTTVSGRPTTLPGAEAMVGLFINTLPVRVQVQSDRSLLPWLQQFQSQQAEARQYEYTPLFQIQQWSEIPPNSPLFESLVVFENYPIDPNVEQGNADLIVSRVQVFEQTNYPLTVIVRPGAALEISLVYDRHRFDADTIARMAGHLQTLLEGMAATLDRSLWELPLLTAAEQHQLLVEWNHPQGTDLVTHSQTACLHHLFEAQVERTPNAIALVYEDQQLTYRELNDRANQLAHYLQSLGVTPDVLVGICLERSLEMVVALLAVLKAGGAYLPLDPSYPPERLAFMIEDAQVPVLLTMAGQQNQFSTPAAKVVDLDRDAAILSQQSIENPVGEVTPDHLAYVIYTSGSTGKPKGVLIHHANVVRLFAATQPWYHFNEQDVWTLFHSYAFDFSVWEIWGALLHGGRLVVVPYWTSRSPEAFYDLLCQERVTVLNQTPSAFRQLIQVEDSLRRPSTLCLRLVIFGGEALSYQSLQPWFERHGDRSPQLVNMYGITETTVHVTYHPLTMATLGETRSVIGKPIPDLQVYLLDHHHQPVPVGVPGEMYIGGAGLARGYLNRPELTAERFIPHPFDDAPNARLYKSGDLARYLPNGEIEYLGRIDHQVKLRGFRIELGEIEALLCQYPQVNQAVVIDREDVPGDQRLVAYIVPDSTLNDAQLIDLRHFLQTKLPDYMVPAAFVVLDALPLTVNGKLDRRALPVPNDSALASDDRTTAPRTPVEEMVMGIWAKVLGLNQVGLHDNFFELGGHSLLATQVTSQVRAVFQVELPLRCLFEAPTLSAFAREIEFAIGTDRSLQAPTIDRVSRSEPLPLSFAQQRLWFLQQLDPNDTSYTLPAAVRLQGRLNIAALAQSLSAIVQRHEILRSQFVTIAGQPTQVILPEATVPLIPIDLQSLSPSEQDAEVQRLALQATQQPFDLSQAPLLRSTLLQLAENDFVLLLTMHHIVSDGWSIGVFIQEMVQLYTAFAEEQASPLAALPIQYADFALWQRQWLQGEVLDAQLAYWKQQLAGDLPILELPSDRPRPAVQSFRGATRSFQLPRDLSTALQAFSQQQGATLFMTLLAAFKTLLYRYTQQADILVGSPIANRNRAELEGLMGCFVNTLVFRTNLSGNPSFQTVLKRVREVALGAYTHQDVPFEKLVDELQPDRDLSHHPLFQVMFVLQNAPMPALELPDLTLSTLDIDSGTASFDLTLSLMETPTGLSGSCEYNTDLFEPETIARMLEQFQTLLESMIANPKQSISDLQLLPESELHQLQDWGTGEIVSNASSPLCLHQLFEAQVEQTPDAIALQWNDQHLSYRELNDRANQLASHLQSLGVAPEVLVGICVDRAPEMVIGILGILKAGGAYVPIDPGYPQDRIAFMLEDAQVSILLTQAHLLDTLPACPATTICLDTLDTIAVPLALSSLASPTSLAYVIYTSGSTGKPKGVLVEHQAICNRLLWGQTVYQLNGRDRVLQKASFGFDVSIWEIFGALIAGATLVLAPADVPQDSAALVQFIAQHQITVVDFVPSLLQVFLQMEGLETACRSLRYITCGGEAVSAQLQAQCFARLPHVELHNLYGPTEAAIDATWEVCQPTDQQTVSIGRPIANTQIYLLDANLKPVPIGVPGELYIGGFGLARGYLNRPELTAERFIPNPFWGDRDQSSARLYKTGDLARWRSDGKIEFLGRIDHQVKIRGFRVELGEVEAALEQHPEIQQAIAVIREDAPNRKQLVAYVVATLPDAALGSLRSFLKNKLPDYMLPAAFVQLESLPLTPNGKVDRRHLPAPDRTHLATKTPLVTASHAIEQRLTEIWQQVLGVESIGIHDNFFELGGDSILSIQVVARANQEGLRMTPKQLFQHQTIAELAQVVDTEQAVQAEQDAVSGELPLTPIQHWFFEQALVNPHHYNQATLLEVPATLEGSQVQQIVQQLLIHHDALRLRFEQTELGIRQVNALPEETVPFVQVDLSAIPESEQAEAITQHCEELQASLDLTSGSLVRVALFKLGANKPGRLLILIHHLAVDGVSWRILLDDFQTAYAQLQQGQAIQLPAKTTSFQHWSQRLTDYGQSVAVQQELEYWLAAHQLPSFSLPIDDPKGINTIASANTITVTLTAAETQTLLKTVPAIYRTQINDLLLSALGQTFTQWTGHPLRVDLEGHGREQLFSDVDLSRTVGWFTSIFPVYLDLSNADGMEDALRTVKEQLRRIPNQGIGCGVLRYLAPAEIAAQLRDLPQAEVCFNYLGQFDTALDATTTFKLAKESSGAVHCPEGIRPYLLEIDGFIAAQQLHLEWSYSSAIHHPATIAQLAEGFIEALRSIIARCHSPEAGSYTPSDFEAAKISQKDFDKLLAKLSQTGRHSS
ncbi:amino acid adenylation domain protein (plasmid) [Leptolyngbya boryana NIES-2135]|jgi:amino acid adenylation domain-containing protein/non-ribosomal peptide synthase protein (TIGR01720 family)|uniref:Amino acid adenylation domain protein n=1 Tax=Leptolyngbya boryana NIES-2135 TaxID=1973484 RepID=A0A1Z4JSP4_LEPBY|nr:MULTISPECIES: non-ribosomal peptide synthetase [Leptolyngbya]BAY59706.1 amino acid adenylation domain protein [Leptolyngbya boryana NIES-2135]MBD2370872.1 non-ribosomal peptide synthetase [Leptolyngbya sp. FACHB-161]MBD2377282.1 non-ribosomal peptide synthetase [Leptolyngbya sp. FACHB-238]MBD2401744.1 non-ribosomal peptide synthetase [Leptolyngbya sp. FACHB-239]MBD2408211.1 non-ribosomal peptide synthetase [Leptolyngbya sp. FACHB-402]